jgi:hypothetical protein
MEVATYAELRYLDFLRAEHLARSANGVVFGMIEVVDIVHVGTDFRREEFRVQRFLFGARVAVQPGEITERKGLGLWLLPGLGKNLDIARRRQCSLRRGRRSLNVGNRRRGGSRTGWGRASAWGRSCSVFLLLALQTVDLRFQLANQASQFLDFLRAGRRILGCGILRAHIRHQHENRREQERCAFAAFFGKLRFTNFRIHNDEFSEFP